MTFTSSSVDALTEAGVWPGPLERSVPITRLGALTQSVFPAVLTDEVAVVALKRGSGQHCPGTG